MNALARVGSSKLVHAYNSFDRPAMARPKERVAQRMQADGWSYQQYKTFSNSASKGKVGMDIDLGAVEPPRYVLSAEDSCRTPNTSSGSRRSRSGRRAASRSPARRTSSRRRVSAT